MTLIQNIEILAVDQQIEAPESNKTEQLRSVTLSVTERQAKKLSLAQNRGILNLTLRNDSDVAAEDSPPVTLNDIRYVQGNLSVVPAEEEKSEVTTVPVVPTQQMRLRIRTMRGTASGQVVLEQYPALLVEPKPRRADHYAGG
jgi:Flp pilus assembly protein CpaB